MPDEETLETLPIAEFRDSRPFFATLVVLFATGATLLAGSGGVVPAMVVMACAAWAGHRMIATPVRVRASEAGIEDRSFWHSGGFIPWSEILEVRAGPWGSVEIDLRDEAAFWERLTPWQQWPRVKAQLFYGLGPAAIVPWGLAASRREVVEALQQRLDVHAVRALMEGRGGELPPPDAV